MSKKMGFFITILLSAIITFSVFADSVRVPIDLKSMTTEELQALVTEINQEINYRNNLENETGEAETEVHTFSNGYSISVTGVTVADGCCTIHYSFSHQNDEPTNFDIMDSIYQNGIELASNYTSEDINSYMRKSLKNSTVEVTRTYKLIDSSTLTIYMQPWISSDKPYVVTIDLP